MKKEKSYQKNRFGLTLLFAACIFIVIIMVITIVSAILFILYHTGLKPYFDAQMFKGSFFTLIVIIACILVGAIITLLFSRLMVKPFNRIIDAMNRLASGDFKTRLSFKKPFHSHPAIEELTVSFNAMATELDKTEILRSDFINNFSHEFKPPIVSIAGFAKLLKRGNLTEEQKQEYYNIIEEESLRLSYMATNVLSLTKVENQTILTDVTKFNLSEQIRNCLLILENKWTKKDLELEIVAEEHYIHGNEELLKQVWINLLDNAVKFANDKGFVKISVLDLGTDLEVDISNDGTNIPDEKMHSIFNKFYQADESHASEGNGVGLSIVKKVVELHSGTINVSSDNELTTFSIILPK